MEDEPININDLLEKLIDRIYELAYLEAERMRDPNWSQEQVWLMSKEAAVNLPENPMFLDYVEAGAVFQGWQWVYHGEEDEENPN